MRCPVCQRDIPDSSRYCASCGARVDASHATTLTAASSDPFPSSGALDGAQFIPGTILAGRYRIVGLLGRGGMGEVYRADDLKLGQPVALKFLSRDVTDRADRLARFHQEVRLARQVSHPHVCRVHDIGETGGQHFLSMEYVDGEDLASLLRRIGRLPSDKALELARQLCAGLAAAHERNVLHRDLKPANVLIDGAGRAHLADFGLADFADRRRGVSELAGTPGYMAPEQQEGREVTTRTDVYALGLVLYEMFTGKRALSVEGPLPGRRMPVDDPPSSPSTHVTDLDPAIERVILRCLEREPARRPASALAVAAALPGGNPLAAALAAGDTPSPDMVAAAGEPGALSPAIGAACLAGALIGLIALVPLTRDVNLLGLTKIDRSAAALTERAHTVVRNLGYVDAPADEAAGYSTYIDYLKYIDEHDRSPRRWLTLAAPQPPSLLFWYRQSPRRLTPIGGAIVITPANPPATRSGMVSLTLDRTGRLVSFLAVPGQIDTSPAASSAAAAASVDWTTLFTEAGLPIARYSPVVPQWIPPIFADARAEWTGVYPGRTDVPIRVEAAAALGRPVYFDIVAPWTRPRNQESEPGTTSGERVGFLMRTAVGPLALAVGILLARRNLRAGRGDRRGAMRVSLFLLAAIVMSTALEAGSPLVFDRGPATAFFVPVLVWVLYIALEPHMRRIWPGVMIGWSRLLAGSVRDPLVGRDVLVGVLVAVADVLVLALHALLRRWSGRPPSFPVGASAEPFGAGMAASSDMLLGGRFALSRVIGTMAGIPVLLGTMTTFLLLFVLFVVLRRRALAIAAMVLVMTVVHVVNHGGWLLASAPADYFAPSAVDVVVFAAVQAAIVIVAVRFGLLTMFVASFVSTLLMLVPIAVDASVPYASSSWLIVATVIALAAYGWHTALAGRPMFGRG